MAKTYIIDQGDHLSGIAADNGFLDFETIWNDPNNQDLNGQRDPHVLFPGDQLFIPDFQDKQANGKTATINPFVVPRRRLFLRLKVLNLDNVPVKNTAYELRVAPKDPVKGTTSGDGFVPTEEIKPDVPEAFLAVHQESEYAKTGDPAPVSDYPLNFDLKIGYLNPERKLSGQQARLNNLGYFAGYTLNDLEQFLWAVEEFACDFSKSQVKVRPKLVGVPLADQNDGEEWGDWAKETGVQDAVIRKNLESTHGS